MERHDDATNFLLESIRKELVSIIGEGTPNATDEDKTNYPVGGEQTKQQTPCKDVATGNTEIIKRNYIFSKFPCRTDFVAMQSSHAIDDDLQRMNLNLNESYELFQTIGERFENINFGSLKSRIKDLHLSDKSNENIKKIVSDLKNTFDQKYMDNRLADLTKEVGTKFRRHPGEFGDIPELSDFFKTCTQLQHGLEKLKNQRNEVQDITRRMSHVVEMCHDRLKEMEKNMEMEPPSQQ